MLHHQVGQGGKKDGTRVSTAAQVQETHMHRMNRIHVVTAVLAACTLALCAASQGCRQDRPQGPPKVKVVTTLFPLYDFARNVGREKLHLTLLLPPGVEAHSFEPKPSDLVTLNEAHVFIYTGRFMEPWAQDIIKGLANRKLLVVDASTGIKMIQSVTHDGHEPAGSYDPHIWLDFDNAKTMVTGIGQALSTIDPANREFYRINAETYRAELADLDNEFTSVLRGCKQKEIVYGGHYAFGYMATRYGLHYMAAQGVSPDAEPTAKDLVRLVDQIRKGGIRYVFYEELTSPKIASTIAQETSARMLMLNAAPNVTRDQFERGVTFIEIMKENLANLKKGLGCTQ